MSYILDALRSSDEDRKKGRVPDLQSQPERIAAGSAAGRSRGRNNVLLLSVPAVLIVLLTWLAFGTTIFKGDNGAPSVSGAEPVANPPAEATPTLTADAPQPRQAPASNDVDLDALTGVQLEIEPISNEDVLVSDIADSGGMQSPGVQAAQSAPAQPSVAAGSGISESTQVAAAAGVMAATEAGDSRVAESAGSPQAGAGSETTTASAQPEPVADPYEGIPHQRQLDYDLQREIPEMNISVHVYSARPSSRLVRIDDTIFREGDYINSELRLEGITSNGVIMSIRDQRFWRNVR